MRRFFHNPYRSLEKLLGYTFRNRELLANALLHRSYRYESAEIRNDNQRLEFLGDAALSLVASNYLFRMYPEIKEGPLTLLRSRLTSGKALARIGASIDLGAAIKLGKGEQASGGHRRASNIGDALEAILGAAYLDGDLKAVDRIFRKLFVALIEIHPQDNWRDNPKGHLQVLAQQRWKKNPAYHLVKLDGAPHERIFTVEVALAGKVWGTGQGACKRDAEQAAAREALQTLLPIDADTQFNS
ncbi:MAG: ribonuclease III [Lentisphaerae bacterium]|nr:ribonuclease III [Lentisphaerota bacterium]